MRIYPEQFGDHLKAGLRPCYLVFGDEPLLRLEAIDAIRQVARKQGFDERHTFVVEQGLDWNQVYDACQAMSLFSARQIIELELPAKVDKDLAARISDIGKQLHPDLLLVLSGGRLNQTQMKAAWFDKLYQIGTYVPVNHPEPKFFPRWMSARFQRFGLKALPDAINFMCHSYEGNLLAASQEIEKLTLLSPPQPISVTYLQETIIRHAHFTPFQLVDTLLEGKVNRAQRILAALRHCAEVAQDHGLRIAVETHPGTLADTPAATRALLAALGHPALGVNFDVLHMWEAGADPLQAHAALARDVLHFHLKSVTARSKLGVFAPGNVHDPQGHRVGICPLFDGALDYASILLALPAEAEGSLEWFGADPAAAMRADLGRIRALAAVSA